MSKKIMILLHGFKRNNEDDFGRIHHFFNKFKPEYEIMNVIWYDNYNKATLKRSYLDLLLAQIAFDINSVDYDEISIISYSTGNIVAIYLLDKLRQKDKVSFYGTVPPFEVEKYKWTVRLKEAASYRKKLKKELGSERYKRIQKKLKETKKVEKYPLQILNYVFTKIIKPDGYRIGEIKKGYFLLAEDDQVVNTKVAKEQLSKSVGNDIVVAKFKHDQLFKLDQEVFIKWFNWKYEQDQEERRKKNEN